MKLFSSIARRIFPLTALLALAMPLQIQAQAPDAVARQHLVDQAPALGLEPTDVQQLLITDNYKTKHNGIQHVYFRQAHAGIGIWNAVANVNVSSEKQVLSYGCSFLPNIGSRVNATFPTLTAQQAIQAAANAYNLGQVFGLSMLSGPDGNDLAMRFNNGGISQEDIPARLMYVETENGTIRLCWDLSVLTLRGDHWWSLRVDAQNGEVLSEVDWSVSCTWGHPGEGVLAHDHADPVALPYLAPPSITVPNSYNVYADPVESPNHGGRSLKVTPWVLAASPFGWHDTNGASGAEFTITRGNNVWAMDDQNGNNGTGASPNGTATLTFDFPISFAAQPSTYLDASTTNLFYWNNRIHDVWYGYGFDDPSGNFQSNNYGRGGTGNDYVIADCQDGSGMNNANMATPPEGSSPRMQMFLWTGQAVSTFTVNSPVGIAGSYSCVPAAFGPAAPVVPLTANLILVNDGSANPSEGCNALTNGAQLSGRIALVDRGTCTFVQKVQNAQNAGAVACVVCNNVAGAPFQMGGTSGTINIPSVMISQSDCALIKAQLAGGVNVSLSSTGAAFDRDGDLDNGIITHEYTHGISNRLTGGPSNTSCLSNAEQMGEGWSDWFALMMTIQPGDLGTRLRGMGTYAIFEPTNGGGIRPSPYTTDMNVNGWTYGDISNTGAISQPHGVGFLWCNMLWEMTWMLIDRYGFDPDLVNGTGGNNIAMRLVIDGMKLQQCGPGFVDGRDAILQADMNDFAGVNQCLIWSAFAKRGLGFSASQGSRTSRTDGSEAFDLPPGCSFFPVEWLDVEATPMASFIRLDWEVNSETRNKGFEIERRAESQLSFEKVGFVSSRQNNGFSAAYSFDDRQVQAGVRYFYRIRQVDLDGQSSTSDVVEAMLDESRYIGMQLSPNPSQGMLNVQALGAVSGSVELSIQNLLGQEVYKTEMDAYTALAGLQLNLGNLPAGQYLVKLKSAGLESSQKWIKQ